MSSRRITVMGLYQEGSRERNRFEQGLGSVAGINQTWSLGENPNGDQGAGLGSRDQERLLAGLPLDRVQGIFCTNESVPTSSSFCKLQVKSGHSF